MATSKTRKPVKSRKTQASDETENPAIMNNNQNGPSDEDIRVKAGEIYCQRIERGEDGSALDDWLEAKAILSESDY